MLRLSPYRRATLAWIQSSATRIHLGAHQTPFMAKRRRSDLASASIETGTVPSPSLSNGKPRKTPQHKPTIAALNPETSSTVIDGMDATRASPDSDAHSDVLPMPMDSKDGSSSPLSEVPESKPPPKKRKAKAKKSTHEPKTENKMDFAIEAMIKNKAISAAQTAKVDDEMRGDPEADEDEEADPEEIKAAISRPPPMNSDYLPLPWKGRLGYACLNTYLRNSNPPVFQSRTTRIQGILDHRHPLKDPTQPEHPIKNRPDKEKPADIALGQAHVEALCLANCKDMIKMLRWNDRYNIRFLRLSSEAFPFASHAEYGYKLASFASEALAEVGKVVAELGHRVSTHPGQFTQLGSPRKSVIEASYRDLEYHDEMLSLLKLPEQQDRDAVMVLHMGGIFGDKVATLDRFRENYARLSTSVKKRLVLENDDMCWGVHDLLPICQELNIPMVLDFHHHNIIFDSSKIREGTKEIIELFPAIGETWTRKGITQKMHHSEPTPAAITPKQRRKHNPRPATLPPCPPDMDLMVEAKDKEQAVFELMKTFRLPGFDTFSDIIPHVRQDDNKPIRPVRKKATPKKRSAKKTKEEEEEGDEEDAVLDGEAEGHPPIPEDEVGMGGPLGRVYWPLGMEEWLRPVKREVKKKEPNATPAAKKAKAVGKKVAAVVREEEVNVDAGATANATVSRHANGEVEDPLKSAVTKKMKAAKTKTPIKRKARQPSVEEDDEEEAELDGLSDEEVEEKLAQAEDEMPTRLKNFAVENGRRSARAKAVRFSYKEEAAEEET